MASKVKRVKSALAWAVVSEGCIRGVYPLGFTRHKVYLQLRSYEDVLRVRIVPVTRKAKRAKAK